MFITNTNKEDYIKMADVEQLPIHYENKKEVELFGHKILVENNEWLWHLHLKLTDTCNARCSFCVEQNSRCSENAKYFVEQVDKMLTEMEREGILFSVSVTGGEPLLFKELDALLSVLKNHDIQFLTMNTNGKYLKDNISKLDGLFDFIDISRHSIDDETNNQIFGTEMPTVSELMEIKNLMRKTKMRIQCVMCDVLSIKDLEAFIDKFSFADDLSFRRLMKLSDKHGVNYDEHEEFYRTVLDFAFTHYDLVEQTIQDYYVYEIYNNGKTNITFSYSNMKMLCDVESKEPENVCREFIIHPNGEISGSWILGNKVISR